MEDEEGGDTYHVTNSNRKKWKMCLYQ